jgi:hypothetical protein
MGSLGIPPIHRVMVSTTVSPHYGETPHIPYIGDMGVLGVYPMVTTPIPWYKGSWGWYPDDPIMGSVPGDRVITDKGYFEKLFTVH